MRDPFVAASLPETGEAYHVIPVAAGVSAPEASSDAVAQVAKRLREAAPRLREWPSDQLVNAMGRVGERFLREGDPLRMEALDRLPRTAGLSPAMAREVLEGMARDWTPERLRIWMDRAFDGRPCLDHWVQESDRSVRAYGPALCTQIVAGSVPGVGVSAMLRSLLVKGPTLLKPGIGDVVLPVLFARGLREADSSLGAAVAVWYWPGAHASVTAAAVAASEVAVVYGSDATVAAVRSQAPPTTRVVTHHHRIGIGVVGRRCLADPGASQRVASEVARAVAMFDQRGCVSPHLVHVQVGGPVAPEDFAAHLGEALSELERTLQHGPLDLDTAAALQQLRGNAELRAASGEGQVFHGGANAPWTVIVEPDAVAGPATFARGVRVIPFDDAEGLRASLESLEPHLQSVGYAGVEGDELMRLAELVGRAGGARLVPFSDLAFPPPWWMHDGRSPLGDLVRWVEVYAGGRG